MHKRYKILLIILVITVLIIGGYFYRFFGNPYLRLQLIGTDYIENSDKISALKQKEQYYLIKRYKYSRYLLSFGFGGTSSRIEDYYGLGIASKDKKEILPPKFQYIYAIKDYTTKEVYLKCMPYKNNGNYDGYEYYKLENNTAIPVQGKTHY